MSLSAPTREAAPQKPNAPDIPLANLPPGVNPASNGGGSALKPPSKLDDSSLLDPESFRRLSLSTISGLSDDGRGRSDSQIPHSRYASRSPAPPTTWKAAFQHFWRRNRALWLVAASQLFAALMNVSARILELDEHPMSPFQLLFVRMGMTSFFCLWYMWYTRVDYAPLGMREVRVLLLLRGFSGFFGIFGVYYSLQYLPLSDTTVIVFLAPSVAGFACYLFFGEPFTRAEKIASIISLLGVVVIARPTSFFHADGSIMPSVPSNSTTPDTTYHPPTPTSAQRLSAIGTSLIGVLGAAGAFTSVRWVGQRAHPMISVNYLATFCALISLSALSISTLSPPTSIFHSPKVLFSLPHSFQQWALMALLSLSGLVMQTLLTMGMSQEKSNRATNMVYTNMLFALLFDRWVFGTLPGVWSLVGSVLILGSAVYVALQKGAEEKEGARHGGRCGGGERDEERAMLGDADGVTMDLYDGDANEELDNEDEDLRYADQVKRH